MSEAIQVNIVNTPNISQETEDGEIEEFISNSIETQENTKEIDEYFSRLKTLGQGHRCTCCGEVYSDPVKLHCEHLIDRFCISAKVKLNKIACPLCQKETPCEDIDDLITDFDIASQIPPKPNALIELINKYGRQSLEYKKLKSIRGKDMDKNDYADYEIINGVKIKKETSVRRPRKTRWSAIDETKTTTNSTPGIVDPQTTFNGVISDILASNSMPKNITISQFKKYTEISTKSEIMNLLTEAVLQNTKTESGNAEKKSQSLSDKEILEMIPTQELEDLFDLEKLQLILLYRDALDKGVLLLPTQNKSPAITPSSSKQALLPTPKKSSSNESVGSNCKSSPSSSRKRLTSGSSKSSNMSNRSSIKSPLDSSDSECLSDIARRAKRMKHDQNILPERQHSTPKTPTASSSISDQQLRASNENIQKTSATPNGSCQNMPSSTTENIQVHTVNSKTACDSQKICDNIRYREDINRLHALYSTMYHVSLKMKDFEHKIESEDYQNSYKTYCDNYAEYQQLYSSLQSVINIDAISADKPDSISNSYTNSDTATPLVNGINVSLQLPNQEQASSTISPAFYAPDSTESITDNKIVRAGQSDIKINIQNNYQQFKKENLPETKKKFGYLWISNLSKDVKTSDLCKVFGKFGHISKIKLFQYKAQIPPTYFGLVFMPNYSEAEVALRQLQSKILNDKQIQIKMLCPDSIHKAN